MEYFEKFKSKKEKWLGYSLLFALIIIIFGSLIISGLNGEDTIEIKPDTSGENNQFDLVKYIVVIIIILIFVNRSKTKQVMVTHNEVIEFVADETYLTRNIYLNTNYSNVRVQRGAPGEYYIEFVEECITYLYQEGVGIVESYPGETIKNIKLQKQQDEIQMSLAKIGIAKKKHMDTMEQYGLTEEEQ